jgi:NTE family protein
MTRALVLGGGGPVGVGWECGLADGLAEAGIKLGEADFIVGTSAGSIVGARLALGMDLPDTVGAVSGPLPAETAADAGLTAMMTAWSEAAAQGLSPAQTRAGLGRIALAAPTVPEDDFTGAPVFAALEGRDWPAAFRCTAVGTADGGLAVWDQAAGVPLSRAVASSCSVPAVFPPVTIGGERYMDGGMRTPLNADLAAGHDAVIVVSCMLLELPPGVTDPMFDALSQQIGTELAAVRAAGAAEVVAPSQEFLEISGWGANLMDPSRVQPAYQAGLRQAAAGADRLGALWNG